MIDGMAEGAGLALGGAAAGRLRGWLTAWACEPKASPHKREAATAARAICMARILRPASGTRPTLYTSAK